MSDSQNLTDSLSALRIALRKGDYATLPALSDRIAAQMATLSAMDAARLPQLRQQAAAAASCLDAARRGFDAARRRIAELHAGTDALGIYDQSGARNPLGASPRTGKRV